MKNRKTLRLEAYRIKEPEDVCIYRTLQFLQRIQNSERFLSVHETDKMPTMI